MNVRAAIKNGEEVAIEMRKFVEAADKLIQQFEELQHLRPHAFSRQHALTSAKNAVATARRRLETEQSHVAFLENWCADKTQIYVKQVAGEKPTGAGPSTGFGEMIGVTERQVRLMKEVSIPHLEKQLRSAEKALADLEDASKTGTKA